MAAISNTADAAGSNPADAAASTPDGAIAALSGGRPALVWRRRIADTETPVAAALKLIEPGRGDFLFESVEGGTVRGRHSMIGLAPDLVFRAKGDAAAINRDWLTDRDAFATCDAPTLDALRTLVAASRRRSR